MTNEQQKASSGLWQTCPKCNGTGLSTEYTMNYPNMYLKNICPVCEGKRVISKLSGLPPQNTSDNKTHLL